MTPFAASAGPAARFIPDEQGRELVPGGFVAITEDRKGVIRYTPDDYRRMVRMGANFQVIRLSLGRLGGWPGATADPTYPAQLDEMVRMGRETGLKTVFKLVVYGIKGFDAAQWENTGGSQDALLEAWRKIWIRYKDDPSVFGYDTQYTWAIFSDAKPVGQVERKYLVDPLARPRPLVVAGRLNHYGFNFTKRTLEMSLQPDVKLGATEVFVSMDRFYPDGFQVEIGPGLEMVLKPGHKELGIVRTAGESDRRQARAIRWDHEKLRLIIDEWAESTPRLAVKIVPLGHQ